MIRSTPRTRYPLEAEERHEFAARGVGWHDSQLLPLEPLYPRRSTDRYAGYDSWHT